MASVLGLLLLSSVLSAQQLQVNFNEVYRFDASIGGEYQSLTSFSPVDTEYNNYYDLSAVFRLPLRRLPSLQPFVQAGMTSFTVPESTAKWEHTRWYGLLGAVYASRFSKNFEIAGDAGLGFAEAVFPNLDPSGPRGSPNLVISAGAHIALNPSYNMSVDIHPNLKYFHSLTPLTRFNGLVLGVGFSAHYRFGEDPDAPQAVIRSLRFSDASIPPLFAAMQSYYAKNPLGRVTITNTEKYALSDVEVSFFQAGFMDASTKAAAFETLGPGDSKMVDLVASFNGSVFTTEGTTPLTGDIVVSYVARDKPVKQTFSVSYDLYDKTALTWDDDRKVGAFITPADSALRNYSSFIRQAAKDRTIAAFSEPLQAAMEVYYALKEIGIMYQVDPTSPFTAVQSNRQVVDSISLARDTLKRLTGDCDDLTVLYCSLLETLGVETAFITVPGHIYAAFNTKVPSRRYSAIHPDSRMTLNIEGELWVPVEITMIGTGDFLAAWRTGIDEFTALDATPAKRAVNFTRKAQEVYVPVGLRETDLGIQYGSKANILAGFRGSLDKLVDLIIDDETNTANKNDSKTGYNRLGILCAQYERYAQAQTAFNRALALDRNYLEPLINLGNLSYLREDYQDALRSFHQAEERLAVKGTDTSPAYVKVLANIARTYYELENFDRASEYAKKAMAIDPSIAGQLSHITAAEGGGGKAAQAGVGIPVLFVEDEK
jgi:tetratricopeptide (TPR) repeat protein